MESLLGELLSDRYWMLDIVGRGVTGTVIFRAEDVSTGRQVTVKAFSPELVPNLEIFDRFRRDAALAAQLGAPGVPGFVDARKTDRGIYIAVNEHHEGETLGQLIEKDIILPHGRVFSLMASLCGILQRVHDGGVVHRDIKPDNILVSIDGPGERVRFLDFGTANLWEAPGGQIEQMAGGGLLAPDYLAPQQLRRSGPLDGRVDIYAMGVVMYRAVVGRLPFEGQAFEQVKTRILAGNAQPPHHVNPDLPEEAGNLIMRAMHRLPEGRFQTPREMAYELGKMEGVTVPSGEEPEAVSEAVVLTDIAYSSEPHAALAVEESESSVASDEWESIIEELTETLYSSGDMAERLKAGKSLAQAYENVFSEPEKALEIYGLLMMIDERDREVLDGLERLSTKAGDWHSLLEILEKKIELEEKLSAKAELLARAGDVYFEKLGDLERAIRAYRRVVDELHLPSNKVLRSLESIYKQQEKWDAYVETLNKLIPLSEPAGRVDIYEEIATTYAIVLKNPVRAKEAAARLLKIQPSNELALGIMSELARKESDDEDEVTAKIDFSKVNPATVIQEYLNRYDKAKTPRKRSMLLMRAARVYEEQMEDAVSAFELRKKAYLENPLGPGVLEAMEAAADRNGRWGELIDLAKGRIAELGDRMDAVPLYLHAAKWMIEKQGQMQAAQSIYTKVLQIDPDNAAAHAVIADLYKAAGKWENYLSYLRMQASKTKNKETKGHLFAKLGLTYKDELGRADLALESFRKALSHDVMNEAALDALEEIYVVNEMYLDLADILEKKVARCEAVGDRGKLKDQLVYQARLHETMLDDPVAAARSLEKALTVDDRDPEVLASLEKLYETLGHTRDLIAVLEKRLAAAEGDEEKIGLLGRMAALCRRDLVQPELAAEKYEQVLAVDAANQEALEALEDIYRGLKQWDRLATTLEKHVSASSDRQKKIYLLLAAGQILGKELKDRKRAIDFFQRVLAVEEAHQGALEMLAALYEEEGSHEEACGVLQKLADLETEPGEKADLLFRMGQILSRDLGRPEEAMAKLNEAVALAPDHLEALGSLRTSYFDMQDWQRASSVLEKEIEHTTVRQQKSALLYAQGRIMAQYMDRDSDAIAYFREALKIYPDNDDAARPMVDYYMSEKQWEKAEELLDLILRKADGSEEDIHVWRLKLGQVAATLGNFEKAYQACREVFAIEGGNVEAIKGMAHALFGMGRWAEAFKYFHMIVFKFSDKTTPRERTDIYYYLGVCKLKLNEPRKGLQLLETILESDPHHGPSLEALADFYEKQKNFEKALHFKQMIAETLDEEARSRLLEEIGDMWQSQTRMGLKSAAAYREALAFRPYDRSLLHKLVQLYSNLKHWKSAVEVLEDISELETDPGRKSRYYHSIAVIYQSEMRNYERAVEYLNRALDADPDNLKEFEAIERILTPLRDWEKLEANYLKMLERISGKDKTVLEINLLHNLGEIYRTRMKDFDAAAQVFRMAADLEPGNLVRHEILAELFKLMPERREDAVREYMFLLGHEPNSVESYKALRTLYYDAGEFDKAWCVCGVLHVMAHADEEERDFYQHYRSDEFRIPQVTLDRQTWLAELQHPEEDVLIGDIFNIMIPLVSKARARPIKDFDLKRRYRQDPDSGKDPMAWIFGRAAAVLGLYLPELYVSDTYKMGIEYITSDPAASVVGNQITTARFSDRELAFLFGKHLTYYAAGRYMRVLEPSIAGLTALLLAACRLSKPDYPVPQELSGRVEAILGAFRTEMLPDQLGMLVNAASTFTDSASPPDLEKWLWNVEFSASRAGLVLCNDLELAVRMLNAMSSGIADAPLKAKVTDLKLFSISESYFSLRKRLGLNVKG
jgi:tetratricopeptide (TPR) repeat protein